MPKKIEIFDFVNGLLLILVSFICVFPFIYIFSASTSDGVKLISGEVFLLPKGFHIEAYKYIFSNSRLNVMNGLMNSFLYAVVGTAFAMLMTFATAFALSRKRLKGRFVIMLVFLFTWVFEAGLIPTYLVNSSLGFVNSFWVMVIPGAVNTFLLIVTRSFLDTLPDEMEESAFMDGANDLQIMWKIFLPLSTPVLATIGVFYAVNIWNSFLVPLIYLQDKSLHPIQLVLYQLIIQPDPEATNFENVMRNGHSLLPQNIRAAAIFLAVFPILFVYPFAQKFFTKGFLIGSLKG